MDEKVKRNKKILSIVLIILVLLLGIYNLFFNKSDIVEEKIDTETISLVYDNSRFFTVSSCVSKYLNYLGTNDTENLLTLLSDQFKNKNSINNTNVYSYIGTMNEIKNFSPRKMYEQRVSKSIYKYYVQGYIYSEAIDTIVSKQEYYLIVILDEENMTFAIEPYDGIMFK